MKKIVHWKCIAASFAGIVLAGCTNVGTFDYSGARGTMTKFQTSGGTKTVLVTPFLDQRGVRYADPAQAEWAEERPAGDHGSFYWGFLPLVPASMVEKEEPEKSEDFVSLGRYHWDVSNDLASAAALSLQSSRLFAKVLQGNPAQQGNADYIWQGKVTNSYYRGSMYSYGITYFLAPVLWAVGAPMGTSRNELWVEFELIDRLSGNIVWRYSYRGKDFRVHWLYARIGQDGAMYPELMKQAMNQALWDLSRKMPGL